MADKRHLLEFRHFQHDQLEEPMKQQPEIIPCRCGVRHKILVQDHGVTTIHCKCGKTIEVTVEKASRAA